MAFMGEMGRHYDGSYAQYTAVPKTIVYSIQSILPWEILGAIPEMYQTVHGSLFAALNIEPGETLLVRGGTSSIGLLATQVANRHGLTVISTTRNPGKQELLKAKGAAEVVIDHGNLKDGIRSIFPTGVDKVLELLGAGTLGDSLQCARSGGTVCMTGMLSEIWSIQDFAPMEIIPATVKLTTYDSGHTRSPQAAFQEFINQVETGEVDLRPARVFSLDEIVEAHQLMESNQANGKLVVLP